LVLILINLVVGCFLVRDYGESRDEQARYEYALRALEAYRGDAKGVNGQAAYLMIAITASRLLRSIWTSLRPIEAWHFINFLSFQMGLVFLYLLCRQLMGRWAATGAVLVFNTQPLLWGHAWINPKDTPFMAFFLGSVTLGLIMVDSLPAKQPAVEKPGTTGLRELARQIQDEWRGLSLRRRRSFVGFLVLSLGILLALVLSRPALQALLSNLILQASLSGPTSLLGRIFSRLAENTAQVPLQRYIQKSFVILDRTLVAGTVFVLLLNLVSAAIHFPQARGWTQSNWVIPWLKSVLASARDGHIWVAGLFLGLCASIRVLGPASGLIVGAYFLKKAGRRAIPPLIVYGAIAWIVLYATWPGLWAAPVRNYVESVTKASDFPWDGKVFFNGVDYTVDELPRSFLPALLSIQFTESAMLLFAIGLIVALRDAIQSRVNWEKTALLALWFFLPILAVVIQHPTLYDNFRHFLFIVPPLFVFAGIGLQWIFKKSKNHLVQWIILAALLLPNLYWDVKLHPYQYVYYNQLVGGVSGAFRRFEMDYWATSYKEAAEYLNATAGQGSDVVVWGADQIVKEYARPDLDIRDYRKEGDASHDFAVILTRHDKDLELYPEAPVVFQTGREGAIFVVVKRLQPQQDPQP
jgi:hypothetical protein